ncbi:major histocompatibility complex class I-related gene protein-like isoform X2 [Microcaecilia unicolor]|nr:major histocompatibility complex class I-related gene protein-like isoform X2 [Microcaecilia unicolor]
MRGAGYFGVLLLEMLFPLGMHCTQSEGHHIWRLLVTGITETEGIPDFTAIGIVDDFELAYYSSDTRKVTALQDWVWDALGSEYFERKTQDFRHYQEGNKKSRKDCMQRYNHTSGVHTLQMYISCDAHGDTAIEGLFQYVYDGRVILTFDVETDTWAAGTTEAIPLKQRLDKDIGWRAFVKNYQMRECKETLKKYIQHGKHILEQQVPPEVRVVSRHSSDGTVVHRCHVTGFYPRDVDVTWVRDGQTTLLETSSSGILPNQDKTYQIQKTLEIDSKDGHTYTCVVNHNSLQTPIIKTASVPAGSWILTLLPLLVMGIMVLLITGALIRIKKKNLCIALNQYMPAHR